MDEFIVRVKVARWVDVRVRSATQSDAEDDAADQFYMGNVPLPEGSPFLETQVLERNGVRYEGAPQTELT